MRSPIPGRWLLVIAAGCVLVGLACGRKTPVRPPEAVAPEKIDNLNAANLLEGVRLNWGRPREAADGSALFDLAGFRIERSEADGPFGVVGRVNVTDRSRLRQSRSFRFVDRFTTAGQHYRYRVVSYTVDDYASEPSNVVEIVRIIPTPAVPAPTPTP